jgi:LPS-assembly protein
MAELMKRRGKPKPRLCDAVRVSAAPVKRRPARRVAVALPVLGAVALGAGLKVAHAQLSGLLAAPGAPSANSNAPVTFLADQVAYDKTGNLVTAQGHVRAWQNGNTLYADKVVINRTTGVATADGHVILMQPGGNTVFADHAVLSKGMKDAVMEAVAARLAQNGRMIANGVRRYNGAIDEMSKVVYSACDLCKSDPTAPPLWQIHASSATRDLQHKMIEYRNAVLRCAGRPAC